MKRNTYTTENPAAHLAHSVLPANTQAIRHCKSQRTKLPILLDKRLISKVVFFSIKANNLVTLDPTKMDYHKKDDIR